MRRRSHWGTPTRWNSPAEPAKAAKLAKPAELAKPASRVTRRHAARAQIRTAALLAVIGLIRTARVMRSRGRLLLLLAGGALAVAGIALSSWTFIPGMLVILLAVRIPQDSPTGFTDPALMPFLVDTQPTRTRTGRPPAR